MFFLLLNCNKQVEPSRHTTLTQQWLNVNSTSWRWINIESMLSQRCVPAGKFTRQRSCHPSRHTTFTQPCINVNSTSWRWINIESMLSQRCVPAGKFTRKEATRTGTQQCWLNIVSMSIQRHDVDSTLNQCWVNIVVCLLGSLHERRPPEQAHNNVDSTLFQCQFNIMTLTQHWINVESTLCACWEVITKEVIAELPPQQAHNIYLTL